MIGSVEVVLRSEKGIDSLQNLMVIREGEKDRIKTLEFGWFLEYFIKFKSDPTIHLLQKHT